MIVSALAATAGVMALTIWIVFSLSMLWNPGGVTLPPAGTPVTDPVPPTQLKGGDVGMWKDHMVMALGNGKVLVSGQVQPIESVSSGPDFLGWFDPTATKDGGSPASSSPVK